MIPYGEKIALDSRKNIDKPSLSMYHSQTIVDALDDSALRVFPTLTFLFCRD